MTADDERLARRVAAALRSGSFAARLEEGRVVAVHPVRGEVVGVVVVLDGALSVASVAPTYRRGVESACERARRVW